MKPTSILIVDDHPLIRRGVRGVLQAHTGWTLAGEAGDGREGIEKAGQLQPTVVVLDLSMPDMSGIEAISEILRVAPLTRIIVLSMYDSETLIEDASRAGAAGYVFKTNVDEELVKGVEAVLNGKSYFSSPAARVVWYRVRKERGTEGERLAELLSSREQEVLRLLSQGNTNRQVASTLKISVRTVENHRARIMRKLGVHSFSDLVHLAIRARLVEP